MTVDAVILIVQLPWHRWPPLTPVLQLSPTTEIKHAAVTAFMQTHVCVSRLPWFFQFLHRWGVTSGPRAAGDGAKLCFCFWHCGQEANEEVVSYTDHELHQPNGGWGPLLWPAHLHQAPRPRQRAVLRPRALQCNGQQRALHFICLLMWRIFSDASGCWMMLVDVCGHFYLYVQTESLITQSHSEKSAVSLSIYQPVIKKLINSCIIFRPYICAF